MKNQEFSHQMTCIGGKYKCTEDKCDYETLNVVCAKSHFADENDIDVNLEDLF